MMPPDMRPGPFAASHPGLIVDKDSLQSAACAEQLKALSEPIRIRIVDALRQGPLAVSDLAELLEAEMVTISHHLGILKHADIVEAERDGRFIYYRLRDDVLQRVKGARPRDYLDFGCCRLELPQP
jgi:DNA-binding transcriptional ArsR family regulator